MTPGAAAERSAFRDPLLDGIRGWAAVIVMLYHVREMLRYVVPGVWNPYLVPFVAGDLAVGVFFVLSGDALSAAFFAGGGARAVDRILVRRYFRLTIPIFLSCALTYLIISAGLDYHAQATPILNQGDWLGRFLKFSASIGGLLRYALRDVYLAHTTGGSYNPFLWTMSMELLGSIYVCGICYLWPRLKYPEWIGLVIAFGLWLVGSLFSLFLIGMVLGYWRKEGFFERFAARRRTPVFVAILLISMAALEVTRARIDVALGARTRMLVEVLLVFCVYSSTGIRSVLSGRLSRFLGSISFPLYLVHFQVIISLMSWLVVRDFAVRGAIVQSDMLAIGLATIAASVVAAVGFRYLERASLRLSDSLVLRMLA